MKRAGLKISLTTMCCSLLALGSCTTDVAGPAGVEEPFAMYGILNPRLPSQTLLISPTQSRLVDFADSIDATVTSTELTTGVTHVWRDSVVRGERGHLDHIYWAPFRPDFESRYRIDVTRSDGAASAVEFDVPGNVTFEMDDGSSPRFGVRVHGSAFRVVRAEITYEVRYYQQGSSPAGVCLSAPYSSITLPLESAEADGAWRFEIDMLQHYDRLRSNFAIEHDVIFPTLRTGLALMGLEMEITVGGESWDPPGGDFDRNVLSTPGTLTNVTNGFGFVGGGYNQEREIWPSENAVEGAGFYDFLMRPPNSCRDFCSCGGWGKD